MNPQQLQAFFAQHKTAALGAAAAGVVGLALYQRKKGAGGGAVVNPQPAGTIPAAAVVPAQPTSGGGGGTYDSTAYDVYSSLQDSLSRLADQQAAQTGGGGVAAAPAPIASTLFAPTGSGNYVLYGNGTVAEVQSDGSQLGLSWPQWKALSSKGARVTSTMPQKTPVGQYYQTDTNLAGLKKPTS